MMTEERLAEIRARCEAATEGPWGWGDGLLNGPGDDDFVLSCEYHCGFSGHLYAVWGDTLPDGTFQIGSPDDVPAEARRHGVEHPIGDLRPNAADSAFIAHARQDVPELLAEVERLRALLRHPS